MDILTKDFVEFIECCVARDVKFLIVGGYAPAAHGHPRATKDLDVWILIDPTNAERLVQALDDFGMDSVGLEPADLLEPEIVVQLGYPPVGIDLITSASGVEFDDCWSRRVAISVGRVEAGFISEADLIVNKRASGRPQISSTSKSWRPRTPTNRRAGSRIGPVSAAHRDRAAWFARLRHALVERGQTLSNTLSHT